MTRETRKELIKSIEKKRGSKVITYVTSDRPGFSYQITGDVVPILHEHILNFASDDDDLKLDLFIYSRGGQSDVPWTIVSMFREYSKAGSFSVLIPFRSHSAATVISIGADEIVMTKKAELGPIDITMGGGPYNQRDDLNPEYKLPISVEDVMGYFSLLEKVDCARPDEKMKGFELLANRVHPLALGTVNRLLEETKLVALRLLNTRAKPFDEEENHKIVKRISSEIYSHSHAISRSEAKNYIGLKQVINAEDANIDEELWSLYMEYKELFDLETPFKHDEHLIHNDLQEHEWTDLNLACVESTYRVDMYKQDFKVKQLRTIPPQVQLSLGDISLPNIDIPSLPSGVTPEQLQVMVKEIIETSIQEILNNSAREVTREVLNNLPHAGFEHSTFNSRWEQED